MNIEQKPAAAGSVSSGVREAWVDYALSYGPRCRDCADEDGVCPARGLPCGNSRKGAAHVVDALIYGWQHGFIPSVGPCGAMRKALLLALPAVERHGSLEVYNAVRVALQFSDRDVREHLDAIGEEAPREDAGERRYMEGIGTFAAPGDQQQDAWLLRFCDQDMREAIWTGPDAERQAWEAWERYAPAWNCYVFRLARLAREDAGDVAMREAALERMGEKIFALSDRLRRIGALDSDNVHSAYEAVVSAWREVCDAHDAALASSPAGTDEGRGA